MRLPAETPADGLAADEALLDAVTPRDGGAVSGQPGGPLVRWWVPASEAVVVGLGLRGRMGEIVDAERCQQRGVEVLARRAGGGALWLDEHMLCGAICVPLPDPRIGADLTESYRWLGEELVHLVGGRRVEVAEARADVAALRARNDAVAKVLLTTCFGTLSPHEVVSGQAKVTGLAQVRRKHAALFQVGILLRDQSPLADFLKVPDEVTREALRDQLGARTGAVDLRGRSASAAAAAIADAMPFGR